MFLTFNILGQILENTYFQKEKLKLYFESFFSGFFLPFFRICNFCQTLGDFYFFQKFLQIFAIFTLLFRIQFCQRKTILKRLMSSLYYK